MRTISLIMSVAVLAVLGCTSQSYKLGVGGAYPVVADRIDQLSGQQTPVATELRSAATAPITLAKGSKAWKDGGQVYRMLVSSSPNLTDHRRSDWLYTADLLDKLNAEEAKHESYLFLFPAPAPTTLPTK